MKIDNKLKKLTTKASDALYKKMKEYNRQNKLSDFLKDLRDGAFDETIFSTNKLSAVDPSNNSNIELKLPLFHKDVTQFNFKKRNQYDLEFAIQLHSKIKIDLEDAMDPKLWNYLALCVYRDYAIDRWNLYNSSFDNIKKKLFYFNSTAVNNHKHAIARLWWGVQNTFDSEIVDDPYHYTRILLAPGNAQVLFDLMERKYLYNNKVLIKSYLDFTSKHEKKDQITRFAAKFILNHLKLHDLSLATKSEIDAFLEDLYNFYKETF